MGASLSRVDSRKRAPAAPRRYPRSVNDTFSALLPLVLLALAFFVLVVLPMRARSRLALRTRELQDSLSVGTEVMTTSGLYGRIVALQDQTMDLEVAPGVVVRWARAAVGEVARPATDGTDAATDGPAGSGGE